MTRQEFIAAVPNTIEHRHGDGKLEIVADTEYEKGACYRHIDKTPSCGNFGRTWDEGYRKIISYLNCHGYLSSLN